MRPFERKKKKDKVAVTIMLCFCLIALTSLFTIKANIEKVANNAKDMPVTKEAPVKADDSDKEKDSTKEKSVSEKTKEVSTNIPTVDSKKQAPDVGTFSAPVNMAAAKVSKKYSMDMVIYNKTLDQYMTHSGMDFAAEGDTNVLAVADGIVTDVYNDDSYGITIIITHDNGFISKYSNLGTDKLIEKGDTVKKSQVISNVGKSALCESAEKPHLHFELIKDKKPVDPTKYFHI